MKKEQPARAVDGPESNPVTSFSAARARAARDAPLSRYRAAILMNIISTHLRAACVSLVIYCGAGRGFPDGALKFIQLRGLSARR